MNRPPTLLSRDRPLGYGGAGSYGEMEETTIEDAGRLYTGHYTVENRLVTVTCAPGGKTNRLGALPAERLPRFMLREIVQDERIRRESIEQNATPLP